MHRVQSNTDDDEVQDTPTPLAGIELLSGTVVEALPAIMSPRLACCFRYCALSIAGLENGWCVRGTR